MRTREMRNIENENGKLKPVFKNTFILYLYLYHHRHGIVYCSIDFEWNTYTCSIYVRLLLM